MAKVIYNVTVKTEDSISGEWLHWLLKEHIPDVMNTGCFSGYKVVRLLEVDESEGPTYAVQYSADSEADYNRYINIHAEEMRKRSFEKWGHTFIAFRTLMEVIQDSGKQN